MSNKIYDVLKWIALVFLPALTTLTGVILNSFNINYTEIILTIMTAITTFMGTILGISNINYSKNNNNIITGESEQPKENADNLGFTTNIEGVNKDGDN